MPDPFIYELKINVFLIWIMNELFQFINFLWNMMPQLVSW